MMGITMADLKDKLINGHEAEFSYLGYDYSIESEENNGSHIVKIWNCSKDKPACIAEAVVKSVDDFDNVFSNPCFEGKSFYDVESEVTINIIF